MTTASRSYFSKTFFITLLAIISLGLAALPGCGGGGGGDDDDDDADDDDDDATTLEEAQEVNVTGVEVDDNFATNGQFTVNFTAEDAEGNALLASTLADVQALIVASDGGWSTLQAQQAVGTCTITTPTGSTCDRQGNTTSTQPTGGAGNVAAVAILDDSGSMSWSDPFADYTDTDGDGTGDEPQRATAAKLFLDSLCGTATNLFGVFDFGNGSNGTFTDSNDLLAEDNSDNSTAFTGTLPYIECSAANVASAKTAIVNQVVDSGGTPLYESTLEIFTHIAGQAGTGGALEGKSLGAVVLSDGEPDSDTNKTAAESACSTNQIKTSTVGLGVASELNNTCSTATNCSDKETATGGIVDFGDTCNTSTGRCEDSTTSCTQNSDCFTSGSCNTTSGNCVAGINQTAIDRLQDLADACNGVYAAATDAAALQPIFDALGAALSSGYNSTVFAVTPIPAPGTVVTGTITLGTATATFTFVVP